MYKITDTEQKALNAVASIKLPSKTKAKVTNMLLDIELHGIDKQQATFLVNVMDRFSNLMINYEIHRQSLNKFIEVKKEPKTMSSVLVRIALLTSENFTSVGVNDIVLRSNAYFKTDIRKNSRKRELVEARMFTIKQLRNCGISFKKIGALLGGRDHSTIMYNLRAFNDLMEIDSEMRKKYNEFNKIFNL